MNLTKIAATAGIAGALSFVAWGLGTGPAHADNDDQPLPPAPGWNGQGPGGPDGAQSPAYRIPLTPPTTPAPPPPWWANGAPMVWDPGGATWGVWWNGAFLPAH